MLRTPLAVLRARGVNGSACRALLNTPYPVLRREMVFSRTRARSGGPAHDTERHPFTLGGTVRVPSGTTSMGAAGASRRSSAASTSCGTVTNPTTMSYPTTAQSSGRSEPTTPGPFGSRRASELLANPRERFGGARSLSTQSEEGGSNVLHQRGPPLDLDAGGGGAVCGGEDAGGLGRW